jgi:hypothetical protein
LLVGLDAWGVWPQGLVAMSSHYVPMAARRQGLSSPPRSWAAAEPFTSRVGSVPSEVGLLRAILARALTPAERQEHVRTLAGQEGLSRTDRLRALVELRGRTLTSATRRAIAAALARACSRPMSDRERAWADRLARRTGAVYEAPAAPVPDGHVGAESWGALPAKPPARSP